MDKLFVTLLGIGEITFVYWFFLMRREGTVEVASSVDIIANGGYSPEIITVRKNHSVTLNFKRTDPSNCLDEVTLPDFRQHLELPLNEVVSTTFTPKETGEFIYSCGMNMFHGKIIVKE
jgi:plastocyanin domain-containing protein